MIDVVDDDRRRWDERHRDAGRPSPAPPDALAERDDLVRLIPTAGRALDIACGVGATALWLAARGLDVVALDVSGVAIDTLTRCADERGISDRIDARRVDLDAGLPDDAVGLDLVVCQRFRQPPLYPAMIERVRPGGLIVVTVLSVVGRAGEPGPFQARRHELLDAFDRDGVKVHHHAEGRGEASLVAEVVRPVPNLAT